MIDERRDELPLELAKDLLDACKEEADAAPKLYRITYTTVIAVPHIDNCDDETTAEVEMLSDTTKKIVEVAQNDCDSFDASDIHNLLYHGRINMHFVGHVEREAPVKLHGYAMGRPTVLIVHSIAPL